MAADVDRIGVDVSWPSRVPYERRGSVPLDGGAGNEFGGLLVDKGVQ
jgi:hypothetical protein